MDWEMRIASAVLERNAQLKPCPFRNTRIKGMRKG